MKRCDYHGLVRGIDYLAGVVEWTWEPPQQCPSAATRYVAVADAQGTSYDHVCDAHAAAVRQMPGFADSDPLVRRERVSIRFDYRWTDSAGVEHFYPELFGWRCSIHGQVCSPFKPVTADELLTRAANDPAVDDGTFVVLRQAIEGRLGGVS